MILAPCALSLAQDAHVLAERRTVPSAGAPGQPRRLRLTSRGWERRNVLVEYRLLPVLLAVLVLTLTPLAHAGPPDQTWLSGLYDNGDYDDVVVLVLSTVVAIESFSLRDVGRLPAVIATPSSHDERPSPVPRPSSALPRAPPAA